MAKPRTDRDSPWKLVLRIYFREAIEFFFPALARLIDWSKPVEFLDKEFQKITPDAEIGKRLADQLVKVKQKRGKDLILLIHLEIQATPEKNFAERMFIYAIRIFEFFHQPPVSLAILCDTKSDWRPSTYGFTTPASSLQFNFTAVKLLDYQTQWQQLEQSQNPFAIVVMSHLRTQETQRNAADRKTWKITLVKRLYELGYDRSAVINLYRFIDWVMVLPEELKQSFWEEIKEYEEARKMTYITTGEEIGYKRGIKELSDRQRDLILRQLTRKIGDIPTKTSKHITKLSIDRLESLGEALLDFTTIDDLTHWLDNQSQ